MSINRRSFAKNTLAATVSLSLSSLAVSGNVNKNIKNGKLKILCVGGHPDDPESGCGGTLAKFSGEGHSVSVIYLTRGEGGIIGMPNDEAATIRTKEAEAACHVLNAKPIFAGQIDGATIVNNEWVDKLHALILAENPDVVFTHWPIDAHKDHQVASLLTIQSWARMGKNFELYFFEVCTGSQTTGFTPTDYVDITLTQEQKRKAVFCHASQNPEAIYNADDCNHALIEKFRGVEMNVTAAEAFVKMNGTLSM